MDDISHNVGLAGCYSTIFVAILLTTTADLVVKPVLSDEPALCRLWSEQRLWKCTYGRGNAYNFTVGEAVIC